jgi:hypothetical protein
MVPIEPRVNPALHDEAVRAEDTDWPQILALYELLGRPSPSPVVTLNRAVAVAMVEGPTARLELLASLEANGRLAAHHRLDAVRAHLLEMAGDHTAARAHDEAAARRTTSLPQRRYLAARAAGLSYEAQPPSWQDDGRAYECEAAGDGCGSSPSWRITPTSSRLAHTSATLPPAKR